MHIFWWRWIDGRWLKQPIPRHVEIDEVLARHIKKDLGIENK